MRPKNTRAYQTGVGYTQVLDMKQVSEITEDGHTSQEVPKTSMLGTGRTFARMLLENPATLKSLG